MMEDENELIDKIKSIDYEISETQARIKIASDNEINLHDALRAARIAENRATSLYVNSPSSHTQIKLEGAREFVQSCQKRINLFTSNVAELDSDTAALWGERKSTLGKLSRLRANQVRPEMELEAETLIREISERAGRYLALVGLLDGQNVLMLDLDKLLICYDQHHKQNLIDESTKLKKSFEKLTKVEI